MGGDGLIRFELAQLTITRSLSFDKTMGALSCSVLQEVLQLIELGKSARPGKRPLSTFRYLSSQTTSDSRLPIALFLFLCFVKCSTQSSQLLEFIDCELLIPSSSVREHVHASVVL